MIFLRNILDAIISINHKIYNFQEYQAISGLILYRTEKCIIKIYLSLIFVFKRQFWELGEISLLEYGKKIL